MSTTARGILVFACGVAAGLAMGGKGVSPEICRGRTAEEAATALLSRARQAAGGGSWERPAVARAHYLGGQREAGQEIISEVTGKKPQKSDWMRVGRIYREAGEWDRAKEAFAMALAGNLESGSRAVEVGAYHNLQGEREAAEALFDQGFRREVDEWMLAGAGGSYLGVRPMDAY